MEFARPDEADYSQLIPKILESQDVSAIFKMIGENHLLVYSICENIVLQFSENNENFKRFCFDIIEGFIMSFKVPVIIWLNDPHVIKTLSNFSDASRWFELIRYCLELFSADSNRESVSYIAKAWNELNANGKPFPSINQEPSLFMKLYLKKQSILRDQEDWLTLPVERKDRLQEDIKKIINEENFENPSFNELEKDLAVYYYNDLIRILHTLEAQPELKKEVSKHAPLKAPNHLRTSFFFGETLHEDESMFIEYKDFKLPFNEKTDYELGKVICAFLNRYGGRIYLGVNDHKTVSGLYLTAKDRDVVKTSILCLLKDFEPNIRTENLVEVIPIPLKNPVDHKTIPGLVVVKIIVKPGDPHELYSSKQNTCLFFMRNDGQSIILQPQELKKTLKQRFLHPEQKIDEKEFKDPSPEEIIDVSSVHANFHLQPQQNQYQPQKMFALKEEKPGATKFLNKSISKKQNNTHNQNKHFAVKIFGLPTGIQHKEAEEILQVFKFKTNIHHFRIFHKGGFVDSGEAIINFNDEFTARNYIQRFNGFRVSEKNTLKVIAKDKLIQ